MKIIKSLLFLSFLSLIFLKSIGQSKKDSLFVFVGEKIEVVKMPKIKNPVKIDTIIKGNDTSYIEYITSSFDSKYIAKYKILKQVYGNFKLDTIQFTVYDHYGIPAFSNFKHSLLYVTIGEEDGQLYHVKYQFADVYKTKNGRWASGYRTFDYRDNFAGSIKPEKIPFKRKISYELKESQKREVERWYPKPFYKIKKNKAIVFLGNYLEELFLLKKNGILKLWGYFE